MPQFVFLFAALAIIFRERMRVSESLTLFYKDPRHLVDWNFLIILIIVILSAVNRMIHWDHIPSLRDFFPYFILIIPTYILSIYLSRIDAKVIVFFVTIESLVVALEWYFGVSSFDTSLSGFRQFTEGELMYNNRPIGLSDNSSLIAYKLLLAWLMIDFFRLKGVLFYVCKVLILAGMLFTFNRSVLLSFSVYLMLFGVKEFLQFKFEKSKAVVALIGGIGGVCLLGFLVYSKLDVIIGQLTRNTGEVELTGRQYIWADFIEFIQHNLIFGNSCIKLWLDGYHAHNSYIQVVATNGVLIALVYFALLYRNIKLRNLIYIVPILVLGLTQYAFYWGISFLDIIFGAFLYQFWSSADDELT